MLHPYKIYSDLRLESIISIHWASYIQKQGNQIIWFLYIHELAGVSFTNYYIKVILHWRVISPLIAYDFKTLTKD